MQIVIAECCRKYLLPNLAMAAQDTPVLVAGTLGAMARQLSNVDLVRLWEMLVSESIMLLELSMQLKPGMAYGGIPRETIGNAAIADLPMLDRMGGYRDSDIKAWVATVEHNWDIQLTEDLMRGTWTMYKRPAHQMGAIRE